LLRDLARRVRDFSHKTLVSSHNPGLTRNARPYMYIGTYCQYVEEKGCCSCKKRQERLFEGRSPPFGPVRFGGSKVLHDLAVIFLARLEGLFLVRILNRAGVQDKKFLFLHNPLRDLAGPNSNIIPLSQVGELMPNFFF
jgi:hypothetical protein